MPKAKKKEQVEATLVCVTDNDAFADALDEFLDEWEIVGDVHILPADDPDAEDDDEDDEDEDDDEDDEDDEDDDEDDEDDDEDDEDDDEPPPARKTKKSAAPAKKAPAKKAAPKKSKK